MVDLGFLFEVKHVDDVFLGVYTLTGHADKSHRSEKVIKYGYVIFLTTHIKIVI